MMRYFIDISYNGKNYHGWQIQKNAVTVQSTIQDVISKILGKSTDIVGSGRTDTGVHAKSQVAHFDVNKEVDNDFIYIGCQILSRNLFEKFKTHNFPIAKIWNPLLKENKLNGFESFSKFNHLTNLKIFKKLADF